MNTARACARVLILMGIASWAGAAAGAEYVMHGRVSFDAGGGLVKGTEDDEWGQAGINTLVLPGDFLWVDDGETFEVEMAGGTFLRMADGSKAEIVSLPPDAVLRGWRGSFYVQRLVRSTGDVAFLTPSCRIEVERDTAVRVDVLDSGATTVSVRWGRVTVRTDEGGAVNVNAGERCWVDPGLLPSMPAAFDHSIEDAFDGWNRNRAKLLSGALDSVPASVTFSEPAVGVYDLAECGEWVYVDNRHYWRPTIVVDYIPYRNGYWSYVGNVGDVWVGSQPFCYVTSHYGRWHYDTYHGWLWSYDPVWSPAWAASIRCGDYYVWAPCDYDYRPVVVHGSVGFTVGGVLFGLYASTCVLAADVRLGPVHVYGVHAGVVQYVNRHPADVHVWNINAGNRNHMRVPFDPSVALVRNYRPTRSIRGPAVLAAGRAPAPQRVQRLEHASGRGAFAAASRTGERRIRTAAVEADRTARVRGVRVEHNVTSAARATLDWSSTGAASAARTASARPPRAAGDSAGARPAPQRTEASPGRVTRTPAHASQGPSGAAPPTASSGRTPSRAEVNHAPRRDATPSPSPTERTPARRTESHGDSPRRTVRTSPSRPDTGETSAPSRAESTHSPSSGTSAGRTTRTSPPASSSGSSPSSRVRVRSDTPSSSSSRSPVRSAPSVSSTSSRISSPSRDMSSVPSRTVVRSSPEPRVSAPSRDFSPSSVSRSVVRVPSSRSVSTPTPSRSISSSAPSRSISSPAPSSSTRRVESAPSTSRSSVSRSTSRPSVSSGNSASSRSVSRPGSSGTSQHRSASGSGSRGRR